MKHKPVVLGDFYIHLLINFFNILAFRVPSSWMYRTPLVVQWLRICLLKHRGHGFESGCRMTPHAVEPLSPWATTTEPELYRPQATSTEPTCHKYWAHVPQLLKPACLEPTLRNKRSHCNETPCSPTKSSPRSPQLEKAHVQQWRPDAAKNKINKFFLKSNV